jgi:deoxyadenosine/deoxycytidine kinase
MTTLINLYGGPGTGKSTNAAKLFAHLKETGINCELVQEYVKQWAWENKTPSILDQFYLFGKQAKKEYSLFNKVDYIITDSPLELCCFYAHKYGPKSLAHVFDQMLCEYRKLCNISIVHIFLHRVKSYQPKGRFQTEQEAKIIDQELREYLKVINIPTFSCIGDLTAVDAIISHLGLP